MQADITMLRRMSWILNRSVARLFRRKRSKSVPQKKMYETAKNNSTKTIDTYYLSEGQNSDLDSTSDDFEPTDCYEVNADLEELLGRFSGRISPTIIRMTYEGLEKDTLKAARFIENVVKVSESANRNNELIKSAEEIARARELHKKADLRLLKSEFMDDANWPADRIEDLYTQLLFDYCQTRDMIIDLKMLYDNKKSNPKEKYAKAKIIRVPPSLTKNIDGPTMMLLPQNFEHMNYLFGFSGKNSPFIPIEMQAQGYFHLPLDNATWAVINQNVTRYIKLYAQDTTVKNYESCQDSKMHDEVKVEQLRSKSESDVKQMGLEIGDKECRSKLEQELSTASDPAKMEILLHELAVETRKNLLFNRFPRLDRAMLVDILEASGLDIFRTIDDIEQTMVKPNPLLEPPVRPLHSSKSAQLNHTKPLSFIDCQAGKSVNNTYTRLKKAPPVPVRRSSLSPSNSASSISIDGLSTYTPSYFNHSALISKAMETRNQKPPDAPIRRSSIRTMKQVGSSEKLARNQCEPNDIDVNISKSKMKIYDLCEKTLAEIMREVPEICVSNLIHLKRQESVSFVMILNHNTSIFSAFIFQWIAGFLKNHDYSYVLEGPGNFRVTLKHNNYASLTRMPDRCS